MTSQNMRTAPAPDGDDGKGQAPAGTESEALKTLALSLSDLVASRSRNPRVRSAAKLLSSTLRRR